MKPKATQGCRGPRCNTSTCWLAGKMRRRRRHASVRNGTDRAIELTTPAPAANHELGDARTLTSMVSSNHIFIRKKVCFTVPGRLIHKHTDSTFLLKPDIRALYLEHFWRRRISFLAEPDKRTEVFLSSPHITLDSNNVTQL